MDVSEDGENEIPENKIKVGENSENAISENEMDVSGNNESEEVSQKPQKELKVTAKEELTKN